MIQEILQNCHDSLEGGHQDIARTFYRVKLDYYWIGLHVDVARHVRSCLDCSSRKGRPKIRGYSPGNILAERSFQVVSMDFVIPLPKSRRGNTALLLFQCAFTGYVMTALRVAQTFEECVYRRFGAPSLIRHDSDPRFMSEVFQSLTEMMQSRSRAILSYPPQANDQHGRSVKTVMQSVRVYPEDPQQQDWNEIAEKLIFAINNSMDREGSEREETQRKPPGTAPEKGQTVTPSDEQLAPGAVTEDSDGDATGATRSLFEVGSRMWLYMERVKLGLTKKLAHRWHGSFRVKKKVTEFAYELELPDRSGYRFYPVTLKDDQFGDRPSARLTQDVNEATRLDFDEELLPEDSWEPDHVAGEFKVEAIQDDRPSVH
ncbi:LOW QUALITY PROTEIN: reverse transcriptase [Phytophthora megakarya]|uniref:Reverse transcriptase n=1 Tax=Phytophthora megakarya TaxID=4795 RepID=A0A225W9J8_9STRA|nr:LOW QUALITY PROTEIN: reverse transcriptase [Phytophthora megakarya]